LNLLDALRAFENNKVLRQGLGEEFCSSYAKLKHAEWNSFVGHFTEWERLHTLDV